MAWHDRAWHGKSIVWHGTLGVWYEMTWYGMGG